MKRRQFLNGLALGAAWSVPLAAAETVTALTLRQLVDASHVVVHAVASQERSRWVEVFGGKRIVTWWRLEVTDPIARTWDPKARVATLGGDVGEIQQWVPHEAQLRSGDHYLLFLRSGVLGAHWVTGMAQGAFPVRRENATWTVRNSRAQDEFVRRVESACAALEGRAMYQVQRAIVSLSSS